MSDAEKTQAPPPERTALPPVTFEMLVYSHALHARMSMEVGGEENEGPDLEVARYHIDILDLLLQKTRGNLTWEEQRGLENSLTELRFRYVQAFEDSKKAQAAAGEPAAGEKQQS